MIKSIKKHILLFMIPALLQKMLSLLERQRYRKEAVYGITASFAAIVMKLHRKGYKHPRQLYLTY